MQTRCIVKGEAQKSPLFWGFSGGFCFSQDRLFSRNSTRKPLNLIKSPIFTNAPCKSTCLYNAPSLHTLDKQERKKYTPPPWKPSFFLFRGLRLYGVYPSFRTYCVYPFPLFSQENGIHHSFFCSVTSGSGDRPKEGCHGGGVYSFFP